MFTGRRDITTLTTARDAKQEHRSAVPRKALDVQGQGIVLTAETEEGIEDLIVVVLRRLPVPDAPGPSRLVSEEAGSARRRVQYRRERGVQWPDLAREVEDVGSENKKLGPV